MIEFTENKISNYHSIKYVDGTEIWYNNGKLHREDGPAIKWFNGNESWHLNDCLLFKKEYKLISILYRVNISLMI